MHALNCAASSFFIYLNSFHYLNFQKATAYVIF